MNENFVDSGCSRASDLIGFLYGEISQSEAVEFQHHLKDCLFCQSDLVAFGGIRQSVADWRLDALGSGTVSGITNTSGDQACLSVKPSALAAIREFFNLSPLWMKGAVAFASLLFCLFAVLAFGRLTEYSTTTPMQATSAEPVNQEMTATPPKAVEDNNLLSGENEQLADSKRNREGTTAGIRRRVTRRESIGSRNESTARRRLTQVEREQLASDLRLVSEMEEPDLDLIADRLNRD